MLIDELYKVPTLEQVFGDHPYILHTLQRAGFRSVVPVMLLPQRVLRDGVKGIAQATANRISHILIEHDLDHHAFHEPASAFVNRVFGCIEDSPVSVLQVVYARTEHYTLPVYAPLQLLHFMETMAPHRPVQELLYMTPDTIRNEVFNLGADGAIIDRLEGDLKAINNRLHWWDDNFFLGVGQQYVQYPPLQLVHSAKG